MKLEGPVLVVCIPVLLVISLERLRTVTSTEVVDSPLLKEIERKKAFLYKRPPTVLISSPRNAIVNNNGTNKTGRPSYWSGGRYPPAALPFQNASYQFAHEKVQISNSTPGVSINATTKPRNNQTRANDRIFMPPYKLPFWGMPYGIYSNGGLVNPGLFPFVPGGPAYPPFDGVFGGPFGPGQYPGPSLNPFPPGTGTPMFPGGQPPLNPTGPPIGAYSPGSPVGYPKPMPTTTPKPKEKPKPSKAPKKPKKPKTKPKPQDTESTEDTPPPKYPKKPATMIPTTTTTTTPRPYMPDKHPTPCPYHHLHPSSTPKLCPYNHPHPPYDDIHHNHEGPEKPLLEPSSANSHQQLAAHSHYHPQSVPPPVNIYEEYHPHESNNYGHSGSSNGHYSSEPINTMQHYPPVKMKRCRLKHRPPTPQFHDMGHEMREPVPTYHPSTKRPCPYRRHKTDSKNETYRTEESRTSLTEAHAPISTESSYESYASANDARHLPEPQEFQQAQTPSYQEIHIGGGAPPVSHGVVLYKPNPQEIIQTPTSVTVPLPFPIWTDNQSQQAMQNQPSQVTYKVDLNSDLLTKISTPVHISPPAAQGQQFGQIVSSSPYMFGSSTMSPPAQPLVIIDNSGAAQLPSPIMYSSPESVPSPLIQPVYDYYQTGSSPFPYLQQSAFQTIPNIAESYIPSYASVPSVSDYGMLISQGATDMGMSSSVMSPYQILYSNKETRRQLTPEPPNSQKKYVLIDRDELEQLRNSNSYAAVEQTTDVVDTLSVPSSSKMVPTIAYPPSDFDTFNPNLPLSFPNSYYQMPEPSYSDHSRSLYSPGGYDLPLSFDANNRAMDSFSLLDNIGGRSSWNRYNYRHGKSIDNEQLNDSNENS